MINYEESGSWWYRKTAKPNIERIKQNYQRIDSLTPEQARESYENSRKSSRRKSSVDNGKVEKIFSLLNDNGAWITDISISDFKKGMLSPPPETIRGIDIRVYLDYMNTLIGFCESIIK